MGIGGKKIPMPGGVLGLSSNGNFFRKKHSVFQAPDEICHEDFTLFQFFAKFFAIRVRDFTSDVR
jgi:hypothetical protein